MVPLNRFWPNNSKLTSTLLHLFTGGVLLFITACTPQTLLKTPPPPEAPEGLTGVYGMVTDQNGNPVSDAFIYAYRIPAKNMRGPADYAIRSEIDGSYILDLPSEPFNLVARSRHTGKDSGPPRQGDVWAPSPQNPVIIKPSQPIRINFTLSASTTPSLQTIPHLTSGTTGFSGVATTTTGSPLRAIEVLAYANTNIQRVPDYRGDASSTEGQFQIILPEDGQYCLVLRERIKGQPRSNELFALVKEEETCLSVTPGEIKNIGVIQLSPYGSK